MTTSVLVHLAAFSGDDAAFTLRLYPYSSGVIANGAGGDVLLESGTGMFVTEVAEDLAGQHRADIARDGDVIYQGWVDMSAEAPVVDLPGAIVITDEQVQEIVDGILAGGAVVDVVSPVVMGVDPNDEWGGFAITVVRGDDYDPADPGRAIRLSFEGTFPSWDGATAKLAVRFGCGLQEFEGTIDDATGTTRQITFPLTGANTDQLPKNYKAAIEVVLASGNVTTPAKGRFRVIPQTERV